MHSNTVTLTLFCAILSLSVSVEKSIKSTSAIGDVLSLGAFLAVRLDFIFIFSTKLKWRVIPECFTGSYLQLKKQKSVFKEEQSHRKNLS